LTPRSIAVALAAGLVLSFAFPEPDIAPLAWVAVVPLLIVLRDRTPMQGFLLAFLFGFAFFGSLIIWISIVGWVSWALLVILQAAQLGLFGAVVSYFSGRVTSIGWSVLLTAAAWVAIEYLRSIFPVFGFTWGELAQSQHNLGWILRTAGLAGGWGTAFLILAVNALLANAFVHARAGEWGRGLPLAGVAAVLLVLPVLLPANEATGKQIRIAIVQGNIPEDMEAGFEKDLIIISNHLLLNEELDPREVDLVVWPESSVAIDIDRNPEVAGFVADAAQSANAEMIVGATLDAGDNYKVMALHVSPDGEIVDRYQKTHLVPFGERVPGRDLIDWIPMLDQVPRDAIPGPGGANVEPFDIAGGKVSPIVSFEGDFGSLARTRINGGGRLLVVATNTSTWHHMWASGQHLAFSQVRAAENGTWVVHAALTGTSGFVAPDGRVLKRTELWEPALRTQTLRFAETTTLYAKWGDWLPWACSLFVLGAIVTARLRTTSERETE
jgi:apolipoprotein N-acyltransferase